MKLSNFFHFDQNDEGKIYNIDKINYIRIELNLELNEEIEFIVHFLNSTEHFRFRKGIDFIVNIVNSLLKKYSFLKKHQNKVFEKLTIHIINTNNVKCFSVFDSINDTEMIRYTFEDISGRDFSFTLNQPSNFDANLRKTIIRRTCLLDGSNQILSNISDMYG